VGAPAEDLVAVVRLLVDAPRAVSAEAVETPAGDVELRLRVAAATAKAAATAGMAALPRIASACPPGTSTSMAVSAARTAIGTA